MIISSYPFEAEPAAISLNGTLQGYIDGWLTDSNSYAQVGASELADSKTQAVEMVSRPPNFICTV